MSPRTALLIGNFLFSVYFTLIGFILLLFLSTIVSLPQAGFVLASGALVSVLAFPLLPRIERLYGARASAFSIALITIGVLLALAQGTTPLFSLILVGILIALQPFLAYQLDILIEASASGSATSGEVRASFITVWNVASIIVPLSFVLLFSTGEDYTHVFLLAAIALTIFCGLFALRSFPTGATPSSSTLKETFHCLLHDRDLSATVSAHLLLYLFFSWMTLYVPFYLHTVLEIPWTSLGWMFSVMLLPYLFLAYPAGWLADNVIGDKELLGVGFIIAGGSVFALGLTSVSSPLWLILAILVGTRIGAVLAESMISGHFFRRISEKDIQSIVIFRSAWPLAGVVAPILGSALLLLGTYSSFFIIIGTFIVIAGAFITLRIRDFR
jgi:MFS family permease